MSPTTTRRAERVPAFLMTALILGLTLTTISRAYAISNTPNSILFRYNLPAFSEAQIAVSAVNQPIHVMAICETFGVRGIAYAEVLRVNAPDAALLWTGQNSETGSGAATNSSGTSATDETRIVTVSYDLDVALEVQDATKLAIGNASGGPRAGYVTLWW